jgi:tRNA threonylcarbamoyladenosine modification (KEOPS) complex  Pcc1 subunit
LWKGRAEVKLEGECAEAVLKALKQEVLNPPATKRIKLKLEDDVLIIEAEDLRALRASLNSFLYWIHAACESLSQLTSLRDA